MTPKQWKEFKDLKAVVQTLIGKVFELEADNVELKDNADIAACKAAQVLKSLQSIPKLDPETWHNLSDHYTPRVAFIDENFDKLKAWVDAVNAAVVQAGLQPAADAVKELGLVGEGKAYP